MNNSNRNSPGRSNSRLSATRRLQAALVGVGQWLVATLAHGADQVDYRYEFYGEERDRISVDTHSVYFEKKITDAIATKGELVYDGISGATPTGLPPKPGSDQVPLTSLHDIRRAGNLAFDCRWGSQLLTPLVAYSQESDYESLGLALNDAIDFNDKNTTLRLGVSHNFDRVLDFPEDPRTPRTWRNKDTTDGLIGISQLLDAKTILTADFTFGGESGYLSDPYRNVLFRGWLIFNPNFYIGYREVRPSERQKEVFQTTLTHFFEPVNGSAELSYRFFHDTYQVYSQTVAFTWHQKLGGHLILEPLFRFYEQSAAYFYYPDGVNGFSPIDGNPDRPANYSADYRLSHLISLTYGLQISVLINTWLQLDTGYHRYAMFGRDNVTSASAYPTANVVTAGLRLWF